jgi:hypothetical protein
MDITTHPVLRMTILPSFFAWDSILRASFSRPARQARRNWSVGLLAALGLRPLGKAAKLSASSFAAAAGLAPFALAEVLLVIIKKTHHGISLYCCWFG